MFYREPENEVIPVLEELGIGFDWLKSGHRDFDFKRFCSGSADGNFGSET